MQRKYFFRIQEQLFVAKKIIKFETSNEYDFLLAGIICPYKDFRLCFELNIALKLSFKREADHTLHLGKPGAVANFCLFSDRNKIGEEFYLLGNKSTQAVLIPELMAFDYFLIIKNYGAYLDFKELVKKIKQIEMVSAINILTASELKSADHLIFD